MGSEVSGFFAVRFAPFVPLVQGFWVLDGAGIQSLDQPPESSLSAICGTVVGIGEGYPEMSICLETVRIIGHRPNSRSAAFA